MACLGTIDVVEKLIEASITDGSTTLNLEGFAAEAVLDPTVLAFMQQSGDPVVSVDPDTGVLNGLINVKNVQVTITALVEVLTSLDVDTITWQSGNTVRIEFNGTPDLSEVRVGDRFVTTGNTNAANDGDFIITAVSDGSDYIDITNPARTSATGDEVTDATGTGTINSPAIHDIASTRDYCECTGLCYVEEEIIA